MAEPELLPERLLETMTDMCWWMFDNTCVGLGAERQFDYTLEGTEGSDLSPRLSRCYELAVLAFTGWEEFEIRLREANDRVTLDLKTLLPKPVSLVHGTWLGHGGTDQRIGHAWVLLDNGQVWEPITALICDAVLFNTYARTEDVVVYDEITARRTLVRSGHYGPWHETDEKGIPL